MSGSLEVRQFLMRYDGPESAGSTTGVPAQRTSGSESSPRISDDQVRRARIAVAGGSKDPHDCARLLDMLGLIPGDNGVPPVQR